MHEFVTAGAYLPHTLSRPDGSCRIRHIARLARTLMKSWERLSVLAEQHQDCIPEAENQSGFSVAGT